MNMLKWLRTREPQPGRDCSVTLPTTATTNQFIQDPDEHDKLQKLFDDVCDQRRDALAEVDRLRERIKELEAERQLSLSVEEALSAIDRALLFFRQGDRSGCDGMNEREISLASTAGVKVVRNAFATEQSMHSAWRKRATEAESDAERMGERIKELEAEVERLTELYQEDTVTTWDQKQEVERLRKAIETAGDHIARAEFAKAQFVLVDALSPSPAAASGETTEQAEPKRAVNPPRTSRQTDAAESAGDAPPKILTSAPASESEGNAQHHIEGAKIPDGGSGVSAAESEPTACSDRGVHAQELPPEEDIIHWNIDWRNAVPGGGNSGVLQQQPELAELRLRLETCEERLGHTESERDAAIAKCNAAEEKIAAWRRLIHEQRARIVALEKEKGFPSRFGDEPMFDVNRVENRVVPPEFLLSKVAKDWVVDPHITDSTKLGGRRGFLKLGLRARRALRQLNVHTVGQLMQLTSPELKSVSGVGGMTLHEIKKALAACDLYLLDDPRRK